MNCKYCGAPMDEDQTVCPACGKAAEAQEPERETAEAAAEEAAKEETAAEEAAAPETAPSGPETDAPKKKGRGGLIVALVAAIAVIVVLVVLLVQGKKAPEAAPDNTVEEPTAQTGEEAPAEEAPAGEAPAEEAPAEEETPFVPSVSYTKDADAFDEETLNQVVATVGDSTLNNCKLAYYYWREYYSFMNMYGSYVSYIMDPYSRLDTQAYSEDQSWDQLFMDGALDTYATCAAAAAKARAEGYTLTDEEQASLDGLADDIAGYATQYGFASADEYLIECFGPYCGLESYQDFMEEYILGASYLNALLEAQEVTEEDLYNYYEENKADYDAAGLEKDDTPMVDVRHILIQPEAVELSEDDEGYEEAVQAAKDAARAKAEEIYAQWQDGEMTEETFSELAKENSSDGSAADGGLIAEIHPGQTVDAFDAWCFADGRKPGDTGIVETEFGYHIIYFVDQCSESYWHSVISSDYEGVRYQKLCEDIKAEYPAEIDLTKAAVYPCNVVS